MMLLSSSSYSDSSLLFSATKLSDITLELVILFLFNILRIIIVVSVSEKSQLALTWIITEVGNQSPYIKFFDLGDGFKPFLMIFSESRDDFRYDMHF